MRSECLFQVCAEHKPFGGSMDKMMTSKDSTSAAGASANDHHNQQEAMGAAAMQEAKNERQQALARLPRPLLDDAPRCPRCDSIDTKFRYYNMFQPRYLCKRCRRYWAQGRSLRNVAIGGGGRKNKRSLSQLAGSSSISKDHLVLAFSSMTMEQDFPTFMSATGIDELRRSQLPLSIDELVSSDMDMEVPPLVFDGASVGGGEGANAEGASNARG